MNNRILIITMSCLAFTTLQPAWAAEDVLMTASLNHHTGWYSDVQLGTNWLISPFGLLGITSLMNSWGWEADLGYNLTPHFGFEGGFIQSYSSYTINNDQTEQEGYYNIPYGAMKVNITLGERLSTFFKLGAMYADANFPGGNTKSSAYPYGSVGFSLALTPKVDLTAQYQGAFYGLLNYGLLGLGLTYHF